MMVLADGSRCGGQHLEGLWELSSLLWVGDQAAERTLEITEVHLSTQLTYNMPKAS